MSTSPDFNTIKKITNFTNDYYSEKRYLFTNNQIEEICNLVRDIIIPVFDEDGKKTLEKWILERNFQEIKTCIIYLPNGIYGVYLDKKLYSYVSISRFSDREFHLFKIFNKLIIETCEFNYNNKYLKDVNSNAYIGRFNQIKLACPEISLELNKYFYHIRFDGYNRDIFYATCIESLKEALKPKSNVNKHKTLFYNHLNLIYILNKHIIENLKYEPDNCQDTIKELIRYLELIQNNTTLNVKIKNIIKNFLTKNIELFIKNNANLEFEYLDVVPAAYLESSLRHEVDFNNDPNVVSHIEKLTENKNTVARESIFYGFKTNNESFNLIYKNFFKIRKAAEQRYQEHSLTLLIEQPDLRPLPEVLLKIISEYALTIETIPQLCRTILQEQEAAAQMTMVQPQTCCVIS